MRVVNTSRISQTLLLKHNESGAETELVLPPGVQTLPDEYSIPKERLDHYASFLSLVHEDGTVVSLQRFDGGITDAGTVSEPESESEAEDDESDDEEEEDE